MSRLSLAAAEALVSQRLGDSPRAAHSRFVAALLAGLAERTGADAELWRVVGLVHDLDYFAVAGDWSRHGLLAADWLADQLPAEALDAIRAHDHRTGFTSATALADLLRLADAVAVFDERIGRAAMLTALRDEAGVRAAAGERPYLAAMILDAGRQWSVSLSDVRKLLKGLPEQAAMAP